MTDRRALAEQLGRLIPKERLHRAALAAADRSEAGGEDWLVALSGGADSVALLLLLWAHWPAQRGRLRVAHFNHGLRGDESDGDEDFCRELCAELGVAFHLGKWSDPPRLASEDQARRARYSFFESVAAAENCAVLLTGHQQDDIAETQLMRLARGASSAGMAAPRPWRQWGDSRTILRPLLDLRRDELQAALRSIGLSWREDSSNAGRDFLRNRLRLSVLPLWLQACGSGALEGAALTREWLEEDDAALENALDQLGLPRRTDELDLRSLARQPRALWRRALRRWIPLGKISRRGFDELLTACQNGDGRHSVGLGFAVITEGILRWVDSGEVPPTGWSAVSLPVGGRLILPNGSELTARQVEVGPKLRCRFSEGLINNQGEAWVGLPFAVFMVRSWMPGDRYQPFGAPGSAKLQDLFGDRKIPALRRHLLPVICSPDGCILWVPGLPPAASSKVTSECVTAVQLTYSEGTDIMGK